MVKQKRQLGCDSAKQSTVKTAEAQPVPQREKHKGNFGWMWLPLSVLKIIYILACLRAEESLPQRGGLLLRGTKVR